MKRIEFSCDICGDVVRKERTGQDVRPFVGFELGLMGDHCNAGDRFVVKAQGLTERHICHCCLAGLVAMARRTLPAGTLVGGVNGDRGPE